MSSFAGPQMISKCVAISQFSPAQAREINEIVFAGDFYDDWQLNMRPGTSVNYID